MTSAIFSCKFFNCYERKEEKKIEQPIFDSIRKPTAPPSRKFGADKPDEKVNPARRKAKYKKKEDLEG